MTLGQALLLIGLFIVFMALAGFVFQPRPQRIVRPYRRVMGRRGVRR